MSNNYIKSIVNISYIENSRMIFAFLEELDRQFKKDNTNDDADKKYIYTGEGGLEERQKILDKIQNNVNDCLARTRKDRAYLHQNPLTHYLMFWEKFFNIELFSLPESGDTDEQIRSDSNIPEMLHLYQTITYLSCSDISLDDLPYLYEDVCITAANILKYKMCYIVYDSGNNAPIQVIARSGYRSDPDPIRTDVISNFEKFINKSENEIYSFKNGDTGYSCLWIKWPLSLHQMESGKKHFYLVFEDSDINFCEKDTIKIRFLRERLMNVLNRDLGALLAYRYDFGYIKSMDIKFNKKKSFPKILHISDLHITDNDSWNTDGNKCNSISEKLNGMSKSKNEPIDLVAVTGDVVNGSESASLAQERYHKAAMYLRKLAESMWSVEDKIAGIKRLPHDWKLRFMLIAGNHDYLTMNELVSINKARQTRFGSPDTNPNTGTMVKFTYFVSFLMQFFDAPIDVLIKNDLNELRIYENLNIKVLMLNTVSKANVLQNNKVGISSEKLSSMMPHWKTNDKLNRVCLMHHGPGYKIDYIADSYELWKLNDEEDKKGGKEFFGFLHSAFEAFKDVMTDYVKCGDMYYDQLDSLKSFSDFKQKYNILDSKIKKRLKLVEIGQRHKWIEEFLASDIHADMLQLSNYKETDCGNEFFIDLISKFKQLFDTMEFDRKAFHQSIIEVAENNNILFLTGHIHCSVPSVWDEPVEHSSRLGMNYCFVANKIESSFAIIQGENDSHYSRTLFYSNKKDIVSKDSFQIESPILYPTGIQIIENLDAKSVHSLFSKYVTVKFKDNFTKYVNNYSKIISEAFDEYLKEYTE